MHCILPVVGLCLPVARNSVEITAHVHCAVSQVNGENLSLFTSLSFTHVCATYASRGVGRCALVGSKVHATHPSPIYHRYAPINQNSKKTRCAGLLMYPSTTELLTRIEAPAGTHGFTTSSSQQICFENTLQHGLFLHVNNVFRPK